MDLKNLLWSQILSNTHTSLWHQFMFSTLWWKKSPQNLEISGWPWWAQDRGRGTEATPLGTNTSSGRLQHRRSLGETTVGFKEMHPGVVESGILCQRFCFLKSNTVSYTSRLLVTSGIISSLFHELSLLCEFFHQTSQNPSKSIFQGSWRVSSIV